MRIPNVQCEICDKLLYRRPNELEKVKHVCCRCCRSKLYKKYKCYNSSGLEKGRGWNKGMSKAKGDILRYGRPRSSITKKKISVALKKVKPPNPDNHVIRICKQCGKEFEIYKSVLRKGKNNGSFCSKSCAVKYNNKNREHPVGSDNPNWKGGGGIKICMECGKEYSVPRAKIRTRKYCSLYCSRRAHSKRMINNPPMVKMFDTDIEIILEDWMKKNNISYEKQKVIRDISTTDFFIQPNICLYADGDYWHNRPKTKNQDAYVNKQLKKRGYKVIRLLGSEIKRGVRPDVLLQR